MEELWLAEGDITATPREENLCRTQAEVTLTGGDSARDLLVRPLGNHVVMVPGSHASRLRSWWEMMIGG
jgi:L-fucose isomerase-like protein